MLQNTSNHWQPLKNWVYLCILVICDTFTKWNKGWDKLIMKWNTEKECECEQIGKFTCVLRFSSHFNSIYDDTLMGSG